MVSVLTVRGTFFSSFLALSLFFFSFFTGFAAFVIVFLSKKFVLPYVFL